VCTEGICTSCVKGVCTAPEVCECFYGYEGADCSTPVSHPACVHGKANNIESCLCDSGWTGRICDVPYCGSSGCGKGYCVAPYTCECMPGYL
jgi:hypothetical protein